MMYEMNEPNADIKPNWLDEVSLQTEAGGSTLYLSNIRAYTPLRVNSLPRCSTRERSSQNQHLKQPVLSVLMLR